MSQTYSKQKVSEILIYDVSDINPDDLETDNQGQLLIHTYIYRWKDGSYHDEVELP